MYCTIQTLALKKQVLGGYTNIKVYEHVEGNRTFYKWLYVGSYKYDNEAYKITLKESKRIDGKVCNIIQEVIGTITLSDIINFFTNNSNSNSTDNDIINFFTNKYISQIKVNKVVETGIISKEQLMFIIGNKVLELVKDTIRVKSENCKNLKREWLLKNSLNLYTETKHRFDKRYYGIAKTYAFDEIYDFNLRLRRKDLLEYNDFFLRNAKERIRNN